jgi:hypothetical protein
VNNTGTGTVTISGGTVSATVGLAIHYASTGRIIISGQDTLVTSENVLGWGTIRIENSGSGTEPRLEISGGTVRNTAIQGTSNSSIAVVNASTGAVIISGGTVSVTAANGFAVQNASVFQSADATRLTLGGNPDISGRIHFNSENKLFVLADDAGIHPAFAPEAGKTYMVHFNSPRPGMIAVTGGAAFRDYFTLASSDFGLVQSGNNLIVGANFHYDYEVNGTTYTINRVEEPGISTDIQSVINNIRTEADGSDITIQFGNSGVVDIVEASISFNNTGGTWGAITLKGGITSSNSMAAQGTIVLTDNVSINSEADIMNTADSTQARAINNTGTGTVTISGGTVSAIIGQAIHNASNGRIIISGSDTLVTSEKH